MTKALRTPQDIASARASKEYRARVGSNVLRLEFDINPDLVTVALLDGGLIGQDQVKDRAAVAAAVLRFLEKGSKIRIMCDSLRCRGRLSLGTESVNPVREYDYDAAD